MFLAATAAAVLRGPLSAQKTGSHKGLRLEKHVIVRLALAELHVFIIFYRLNFRHLHIPLILNAFQDIHPCILTLYKKRPIQLCFLCVPCT